MTDKAEFHTEFHWHRSFHAQDLVEHNSVSLQAGGLLTRLVHLMFSVKGPIKNDIAWITRRTGVRDKRTVIKALDELIAAEIIRVTDNGLVHDRSMLEIKNKSAQQSEKASKRFENQDASAEQSANSSPSDADLMAIKSRTVGAQVIEKQQYRDEPFKEQKQSKNKTSPLPPQAVPATTPLTTVNGGGSDHVQAIVQAFDRLIVEFWGKQARRRSVAKDDLEVAADWLDRTDGDVGCVIHAIEECMAEQVDRGHRSPGSLSYYGNSVPGFMATASRPCTLTAATVGKPFSAGPAKSAKTGQKAVWLTVYEIALDNGWRDIAEAIMGMAEMSVDDANSYAESMRGTVSAKKERAAA